MLQLSKDAGNVENGDQRISLTDRYGDKNGYIGAVMAAAADLVKDKLMLPDDIHYVVEYAKANAAIFD